MLEVRRQRLEQRVLGAAPAGRRPPRPAWRRACPSPASARSGSRSSLATGRGASGQPPRPAARTARPAAETWAEARSSDDAARRRPARRRSSRTTARGGLVGVRRRRRGRPPAGRPARRTSASRPARAGRAAYLRREVRRCAAPGARPSTDASTPPRWAQPSALAREAHGLVGLAAQHGVDDQRLEPGVPGAARLGGPGVDLGGGEGDLAGVAQHGGMDGRRVGRVDDLVDVRLDDLDAQPDQVDGLAEGDDPGQRPRRGAEDRGRGVARERGVVARAGTSRRSPWMPAWRIWPTQDRLSADSSREPRHVGEHPRHRGGAEGAGRTAQRRGGTFARAPVAGARGYGAHAHVPTLDGASDGVTTYRRRRNPP